MRWSSLKCQVFKAFVLQKSAALRKHRQHPKANFFSSVSTESKLDKTFVEVGLTDIEPLRTAILTCASNDHHWSTPSSIKYQIPTNPASSFSIGKHDKGTIEQCHWTHYYY